MNAGRLVERVLINGVVVLDKAQGHKLMIAEQPNYADMTNGACFVADYNENNVEVKRLWLGAGALIIWKES